MAIKIIIMADIIYKSESFKIIGLCMEVHNNLGKGFLEIVYKDALEFEFRHNQIPFDLFPGEKVVGCCFCHKPNIFSAAQATNC